MAQLTAQGHMKNLSDGIFRASASEPKVPVFPNTLNSYHYSLLRNLKLGSLSSSICTLSSSSTSSSSCFSTNRKKSPEFSVKTLCASNGEVGDDECYEYDSESEWDELAGFRCLVLDVSYRPVNVVCWRRALCLKFTDKVDVLEYYNQTVTSPAGLFYIPAVLSVFILGLIGYYFLVFFPVIGFCHLFSMNLSFLSLSMNLHMFILSCLHDFYLIQVRNLLQVVKRRRVKANLNRSNILFRDNYSCQYCSSHENLTIDHIVPIAEGGEWKWENVVTACSKCNFRKGQRTLEEANMKLIRVPKAPKGFDILAIPLTSAAIRMLKLRKGMPEEWRRYLADPVHSS